MQLFTYLGSSCLLVLAIQAFPTKHGKLSQCHAFILSSKLTMKNTPATSSSTSLSVSSEISPQGDQGSWMHTPPKWKRYARESSEPNGDHGSWFHTPPKA